MSIGWTVVAILGLAVITLVTRGFFVLPDREIPLPAWLRQGLRYAPLAALTAVVAPEVVMSSGHLITTWKDARLFAAAAGAGWYFWQRSILGTILAGTAVMMLLHLGLGW